MTKEIMKQALEALKNTTPSGFNMETDKRFYSAIESLEKALKQEQDEPVAYFSPQEGGFYWAKPTTVTAPVTVDVEPLPLYTTPQTKGCDECGNGGGYALYCVGCAEKFFGKGKEWVGLTEDEMFDCLVKFNHMAKRLSLGFKWFAEAIEAKLKQKNNIGENN